MAFSFRKREFGEATPLQNDYNRFSTFETRYSNRCGGDATHALHSWLVENDCEGSALDVQCTGRDGRAKADVPLRLQTHPLHRAGVWLIRVARG